MLSTSQQWREYEAPQEFMSPYGTVVQGTLRLKDLVQAFVTEIFEHWLDLDGETQEETDKIYARFSDSAYWSDKDQLMADLEFLTLVLESLAPEGLYFGAHSSDASDFGYWEAY